MKTSHPVTSPFNTKTLTKRNLRPLPLSPNLLRMLTLMLLQKRDPQSATPHQATGLGETDIDGQQLHQRIYSLRFSS